MKLVFRSDFFFLVSSLHCDFVNCFAKNYFTYCLFNCLYAASAAKESVRCHHMCGLFARPNEIWSNDLILTLCAPNEDGKTKITFRQSDTCAMRSHWMHGKRLISYQRIVCNMSEYIYFVQWIFLLYRIRCYLVLFFLCFCIAWKYGSYFMYD